MVCSFIVWNGVGKLMEMQGRMDAQQYCEILEEGVMESVDKLEISLEEAIFQQDIDPKHTSKKEGNWFQSNEINVMSWPAQSPNLNPITV